MAPANPTSVLSVQTCKSCDGTASRMEGPWFQSRVAWREHTRFVHGNICALSLQSECCAWKYLRPKPPELLRTYANVQAHTRVTQAYTSMHIHGHTNTHIHTQAPIPSTTPVLLQVYTFMGTHTHTHTHTHTNTQTRKPSTTPVLLQVYTFMGTHTHTGTQALTHPCVAAGVLRTEHC